MWKLFMLHQAAVSCARGQRGPKEQHKRSRGDLSHQLSTFLVILFADCPSAGICHLATKCNRILVGRFNLYCNTTNICL